jgi:hypothetical protein
MDRHNVLIPIALLRWRPVRSSLPSSAENTLQIGIDRWIVEVPPV